MAVNLNFDTSVLASTYDAVSDTQFYDGRILIDRLKIKAGDSVLDIGCGTGRLGRYVSEIAGSRGRFLGVDPLEERINIAAKKNCYSNAEYHVGIAENLNFISNSSIDITYMNWVFQWIIDRDCALKEIYRVLKPGGKIGIVMSCKELNKISGMNPATERVMRRPPYNTAVNIEQSPQYQHNLTTTELTTMLVDSGFIVADIQVRLDSRYFPNSNAGMDYLESSFFGNYLNHVPVHLRDQAKADIEAELKKLETDKGLYTSYYAIFAVAEKPTDVENKHISD